MIRSLVIAILILWAAIAHAAPSVDVAVNTGNTFGTATPLTFSLTTNFTNEVILLHLPYISSTGHVKGISDTAGVTFFRRALLNGITSVDYAEEWYGISPGMLSGDIVTVTYEGGVTLASAQVITIAGAAMPNPFDPLFGQQAVRSSGALPVISTLGTDDLVTGMMRLSGGSCGAGGAQPGPGWSASATNGILVEWNTFASAQTNLTVPMTNCPVGDIETAFAEAFVASDGLGNLAETTKQNAYAVLQTGLGTSKDNLYVIVVPAIGTSKLNLYGILLDNPVPQTSRGSTWYHAFPP